MPKSEPIFENGPTQEQLDAWKQEYGDNIFMTEFEDSFLIWRPVTRREWKQIMKMEGQGNNTEALFKEERLLQTCLLWPDSLDVMALSNMKAGIPTVLFEAIVEKSGFVARDTARKL